VSSKSSTNTIDSELFRSFCGASCLFSSSVFGRKALKIKRVWDFTKIKGIHTGSDVFRNLETGAIFDGPQKIWRPVFGRTTNLATFFHSLSPILTPDPFKRGGAILPFTCLQVFKPFKKYSHQPKGGHGTMTPLNTPLNTGVNVLTFVWKMR
jgi:hypothetical protein